MQPKEIFLCAICNISSGSCKEDCKFCTQSIKHRASIEHYKQKDINLIVDEAKKAYKNKALGFCLVTAGKELDDAKLEFVCKATKAVKKEVPNLHIIACNGIATLERLKELKKSGVDIYNHNLETSKEYYQNICTTMDWDERYETCQRVKEANLELCSGGIFGIGESKADRVSFVKSLKSLNPTTLSINFFHPDSALNLNQNTLDVDIALDIIRYLKREIQNSRVMIAGGREVTFKNRVGEIFEAGVDAIVVGDYLTKGGDEPDKDIQMLQSLGLKIAQNC